MKEFFLKNDFVSHKKFFIVNVVLCFFTSNLLMMIRVKVCSFLRFDEKYDLVSFFLLNNNLFHFVKFNNLASLYKNLHKFWEFKKYAELPKVRV